MKHFPLPVVVFLALHSLAHAAAERHLTPRQAAALAVVNHPALAVARDARNAAAAERLLAGVLPNPSLALAGDRVVGSVRDVPSESYSVGVDWEITRLLTLGPNLRAADAHYAAAGLDLAWEEYQIAAGARLAVYRYALADRGLVVARQAQRDLVENLIAVRSAGTEETALSLAAAEAASSQSKVARLAQEQTVEDERLALNAALGLPPAEKIIVETEAALASLRSKDLPVAANLETTLEEARPDLLALQMGRQSQDAKLRGAILGRFPAISLGVQQGRDTGDITTRGVSLTVSLPIFDRNQGGVAVEKATRQTLADEYNYRVATARSEIARALVDFRLLRRQLAAAEEALAARRKLASALEQSLRERGVDAATVYNARADVTTSEADILKLETALAETATALDLATGKVVFP